MLQARGGEGATGSRHDANAPLGHDRESGQMRQHRLNNQVLAASEAHRAAPAGAFTTILLVPIFSKRSYTRTMMVCSSATALPRAARLPLEVSSVLSGSVLLVGGIGTLTS